MKTIPGIYFPDFKGLAAVTFTGVDHKTDLDRLLDLSEEYPLIEWGVLLGSKDTPRYPSMAFIGDLIDDYWLGSMPFALHLCGKFAKTWVSESGPLSEDREDLVELTKFFDRIQLNLSFPEDFDIGSVRRAIETNEHPAVITQFNPKLTPTLVGLDNHCVLFDASGGRGVSAVDWPLALETQPNGYAGGLGPDNIILELPRIHAASLGHPYWIDMETKVRTDDWLDLDKCVSVMKAVNNTDFIPRWTQEMLDAVDREAEELLSKLKF